MQVNILLKQHNYLKSDLFMLLEVIHKRIFFALLSFIFNQNMGQIEMPLSTSHLNLVSIFVILTIARKLTIHPYPVRQLYGNKRE